MQAQENKGLPLVQPNEEEKLFAIMTTHYNDLFRYGIRFTADPENTKDIVNQFFLHVWEKREKFLLAENTRSYLFVSFKRFLIDYLRRSFPFTHVADYPEEPMEHAYEDYLIRFQENEALKNALHRSIQSLPSRQKELLMLRFYENLSCEEIAAKSSLSIRAVYNKIYLALKKLRSSELLQQIRKNNIFRSFLYMLFFVVIAPHIEDSGYLLNLF